MVAFIGGVLAAEALKRPRVVRAVRWPTRAARVMEMGAIPETHRTGS